MKNSIRYSTIITKTQTIIDGAKISGVTVDDIQTVLNLWDAWKYCIEHVASKILIESGNGILTIGKDHAEEFNAALYNWYLQDELQPLKDCLRKCIRTLEF